MGTGVALALVVLAIPTFGASCVPLWVLADRECQRARAAGSIPPRDAALLRDFGFAGTVVFGAGVALMVLYVLYFANRVRHGAARARP